MEELQSTEILDREILEDARKKAHRILKSAESTINEQNIKWEKKTAESINALEKKYDELKKMEAEKVMARLPIDKLRAKNEKIEKWLREAEDVWYQSLKRERILELLTGALSKRLDFYGKIDDSKKKNAYYYGITSEEADSILKSVNVFCEVEEIPLENRYPSVILETEDVKITASIQKIVNHYLHVNRFELVEALVGREFMREI